MNQLSKQFGAKIRHYRNLLGYSQEYLAELVNVSTNTISAIELGKNFTTDITIEKFCTALNVRPSDLFDFDVEQNSTENQLLNQIIARAKKLTPQQQKQLIKILDSFD